MPRREAILPTQEQDERRARMVEGARQTACVKNQQALDMLLETLEDLLYWQDWYRQNRASLSGDDRRHALGIPRKLTGLLGQLGLVELRHPDDCPVCDGKRVVDDKDCKACHGTGVREF